MRFRDIKHVYVLDNGNGNVMAYMIDPHASKPEAVPLMNANGEPAGFARKANGEMLVGSQLVGTDFETFSDCRFTATSFKAMPTTDNRDVLLRYLRAWHKKLEKRKGSHLEKDGNNAVWLIGCPTGWTDPNIIRNYRKLFLDAGFVNPIIIPESDAAIAHARTVSSDIDEAAAHSGVLCQDFGAYSNDSTFISTAGIRSYGGFVGASIIDKMIVMLNLNHISRFVSKNGNSPLLVDAVRRRVEKDPVFRDFMLLQGRWLKEQYFEKKKDGTLREKGIIASVTLDEYPDFDGMDQFRLFLNSEMMNFILAEQKIRDILGTTFFRALPAETQREIGEKTWQSCLETFLLETARAIPDFKKRAFRSDEDRPIVLITGGAAEMDIIESTIWDVYPNVSVVSDPTPLLSIARGLSDIALGKISKCTAETEITQACFYDFEQSSNKNIADTTEKCGKNKDTVSGKKENNSSKPASKPTEKQKEYKNNPGSAPKKTENNSRFVWKISDSLQKENAAVGYVFETGKDQSNGKNYADIHFSRSAEKVSTLYVYRDGIWLQTFSSSSGSFSISADQSFRLNTQTALKPGDVITTRLYSSAHRLNADKKGNTISVQHNVLSWEIPSRLRDRLFGYVMRADSQDVDIVVNRKIAYVEKFWVYRNGVLIVEVTGKIAGADSELSIHQLKNTALEIGDIIIGAKLDEGLFVTAKYNKSSFCISILEERKTAIILKRNRKFSGSLRDYFIRIDGVLHTVKSGSYQTLYVTPERHHIELGNMNVLGTAPIEAEKQSYDLDFEVGYDLELDFTDYIVESNWVYSGK